MTIMIILIPSLLWRALHYNFASGIGDTSLTVQPHTAPPRLSPGSRHPCPPASCFCWLHLRDFHRRGLLGWEHSNALRWGSLGAHLTLFSQNNPFYPNLGIPLTVCLAPCWMLGSQEDSVWGGSVSSSLLPPQ